MSRQLLNVECKKEQNKKKTSQKNTGTERQEAGRQASRTAKKDDDDKKNDKKNEEAIGKTISNKPLGGRATPAWHCYVGSSGQGLVVVSGVLPAVTGGCRRLKRGVHTIERII